MWLKDTGILNRVKDDITIPPIPIPQPKMRHNQPLNLTQLGIIMIILVVGLVVGASVFVIEVTKKSKCKLAEGIELSDQHDILRKSRALSQNHSN